MKSHFTKDSVYNPPSPHCCLPPLSNDISMNYSIVKLRQTNSARAQQHLVQQMQSKHTLKYQSISCATRSLEPHIRYYTETCMNHSHWIMVVVLKLHCCRSHLESVRKVFSIVMYSGIGEATYLLFVNYLEDIEECTILSL